MDYGRLGTSARESVLIARDELAAAQWEQFLHADAAQDGAFAARSLPLTTISRFFTDRWQEVPGSEQSLLRDVQARALWKAVIGQSRIGSGLIDHDVVAGWCHTARRRLAEWSVDWRDLRSGDAEPDVDAFLEWSRAYAGRLDSSGWIDGARLARRSEELPLPHKRALVLLDPPEPTPALQRYLRRASGAGVAVEVVPAPTTGRGTFAVTLPDPAAELEQAVAWCVRKLPGDQPVALVVPDLDSRRSEIGSLLGEALVAHGTSRGDLWLSRGPRIEAFAAFGAALAAIALLTGAGKFPSLSRLLRSPFFGDAAGLPASCAGAALEAKLRDTLLAQWPVAAAYRRGGLAPKLAQALPEFARGLERAFGRLDRLPRLATPAQWAAAWRDCLRDIGWEPRRQGTPPEALTAWEAAIRSFAERSAITGAMVGQEACDVFGRILRETRVTSPLPRAGIHVFEAVEQVGPGYAAVWATGMSERAWPQRPALNPMLSRRLQVAHCMPLATPELAYAASRKALEHLVARVPSVVLSAPERVEDVETGLSDLCWLMSPKPLPSKGPPAPELGARPAEAAAAALEVVEDPAPPCRPGPLAGATRLLELQARCPVRAFCEFRLGARALERAQRGLGPAARGAVLHRALELLFQPYAGADEPVDLTRASARVWHCVRAALRELVPWERAPWNTIVAIESARSVRLIEALLEKESSREPFLVAGLEVEIETRLGEWILRGRVDRIDRLADERLVIFDYKTGATQPAAAWFSGRLRAPQLPLYAMSFRKTLAGFATVSLAPGEIDLIGTGLLPDDMPVKLRGVPEGRSWSEQLDVWEGQLEALLNEYVAGDVRMFADDAGLAEGDYAPLTRIYAALAQRGPDAP